MATSNNYIQSLKATSLFGGVQVYSILISIISAKFVAVLLGPEGMGISGLLSSTTGFISMATCLGLGTSAVKDISLAYATGDMERFSLVTNVFRRLVWITGLLGMSVCLFFSPLWSKLTFDNSEYVLSFAVLSLTLLFGQISSGQGVVLQGTRRFKDMAKSRMLGQTIGLCISIPLFFFLGIQGIVPSIFIMSIVGLCLSYYFSRKVKVARMKVPLRTVFNEGKQMLKVGFLIAMQGFASLLVVYLVRLYISHEGGVAEVGLYNSGFGMVETSVGMVFSAIAAEYYPRLSSLSNNTQEFSNAINQQIHLTILLLTPLIVLFLLLGRLAIVILLSTRFLGITIMIQILVISMFLKAPGWCYGYAFLAKSDSKAFWLNEVTSETIRLVSFIVAYKYWGLNGVAVAFFLLYVYYTMITGFLCNRRYGYRFDHDLLKKHLPQLCLLIVIFACISFVGGWLGFSLAMLLGSYSVYNSYRQLNQILNVREALQSTIRKVLNKG